ncbi:MAG: YggS family pyridoxal phosphate-dependent enzyme [Candidatus Krumholzibacteria bacterium]|nr:YggS family pyridoxal phosphate-dependent enzyme [Candidatus Krumholzibacteria bacterium]
MANHPVAERLARVRDRIAEACNKAGRLPEAVKLVAVSKRIALPLVVEACRAGQWDLGENRVVEAVDRQPEMARLLAEAGLQAERLRWHFIGHLQSNKAGKAAGRFHMLHSVDSVKLAEKLSRLAIDEGRIETVLMEINISGEARKQGLAPEEACDAVARIALLQGLDPRGLMGMAKFGSSESELRTSFASLRLLAEDVQAATGLALPELSMGMSGDFEAAIAEGSTMVRIGGAIFGPRMT